MLASKHQINSSVLSFLEQKHKVLINGNWMEARSKSQIGCEDPSLGEVIAKVPDCDAADVDLAVKSSRNAFDTIWKKTVSSERARLLFKLADIIEKHQEDLAQLETLNNGKPLNSTRAGDIPFSVAYIRYMAGWATKLEGSTITPSFGLESGKEEYFTYTTREPVGVVAQIIPWNAPFLMAILKIAPALAAGCTVILKPAEETPLTALWLGHFILEAGFPPGVVNIITGRGETAGAALAAHPDVDKIAFTGSTEVGKSIVQASTGNMKQVTLELGGKSPNIILEDADLTVAIEGSAKAIFSNQGESCSAGSRLFVHASHFDQVVEGIAERAKSLKIGPGLDLKTQMGPLVSAKQLKRVCGYIRSGIEQGAEIVTGGKALEGKGYFVEPTVFIKTTPEMKISREEIFGPVVTITPFKDNQELVKLANDSIYGLAAGIWTKDFQKAHRLAKELEAGTIWINCYNMHDPEIPFGGFKQSGWGYELGKAGVELYTRVKSHWVKM